MTGFYKMHRGWMSDELFKGCGKFTRREAWVWLIENTAWKDSAFPRGSRMVPLKRGQLIGNRARLATAWKWSEREVRTFIALLINDQKVTSEVTNNVTILTLCDYGKFQDKRPVSDQSNDQQTTSKGPDIKKGKKNINNIGGRSKTELPQVWSIPQDWIEKAESYAASQGYSRTFDWAAEAEKFHGHHRARGNKYVDWGPTGAWKTWYCNACRFYGGKPKDVRPKAYQAGSRELERAYDA